MKKFVVVAAAIAAFGFVGSASAADMPVKGPVYKAPMYAPTPVYNWTGFYIGLNGGVGIGRTTGDLFPVNGDGNRRADRLQSSVQQYRRGRGG